MSVELALEPSFTSLHGAISAAKLTIYCGKTRSLKDRHDL